MPDDPIRQIRRPAAPKHSVPPARTPRASRRAAPAPYASGRHPTAAAETPVPDDPRRFRRPTPPPVPPVPAALPPGASGHPRNAAPPPPPGRFPHNRAARRCRQRGSATAPDSRSDRRAAAPDGRTPPCRRASPSRSTGRS